MEKWKIDIPVLILFFNRPKLLARVFEQVKIARPRKLYLYQDGPRKNVEADKENLRLCQEVVSDIDWECEVHTNYCEENKGCDPSEYLAQKWMFETEEMGIVLEDDDVPSQSFFPYCKELLEKYKDDQRINMICGMNNLETYDTPYDYVFADVQTITGWASWKRIIDEWKESVDFVNDPFYVKKYKDIYQDRINVDKRLDKIRKENDEKIAYYETIMDSNASMNHRLYIIPCKNLISNIGNDGESTHGAASLDLLPRGIRRIFNMKTYELEFPLKHPPYVIEDVEFRKKVYRVMGKGHPWVMRWRKIESFFLYLKAGKVNEKIKKIPQKIKNKFKGSTNE